MSIARVAAEDRIRRPGERVDRRVGIGDVAGTRDPHRAEDGAAEAHHGRRQRVDLDVERQDADGAGPRPHDERRPSAGAHAGRAVLVDETALRELANERPDRLAVEAGPLSELRPRDRPVAMNLAQDGREVVAPDPLAVAPQHGQHMSHRTPKGDSGPAGIGRPRPARRAPI